MCHVKQWWFSWDSSSTATAISRDDVFALGELGALIHRDLEDGGEWENPLLRETETGVMFHRIFETSVFTLLVPDMLSFAVQVSVCFDSVRLLHFGSQLNSPSLYAVCEFSISILLHLSLSICQSILAEVWIPTNIWRRELEPSAHYTTHWIASRYSVIVHI
jgi:hypothetical protein